jgi:prepilin-type N-terminal cleavage/methylation domain-containing protein
MQARLARRSIRRAGFSLLELMIAVGILSVVLAAVMQSFVVQNRAYTVTDQVVQAQQNLRAVSWLIERDIRMSGFMVPEAASLCALDQTNAPDTLWLTDSEAIDPSDQVRASLGAAVSNYALGTGAQALIVDNVVVDGKPYYDTDGDGNPDADFDKNHGVILADADDPARGTACGVVTAVKVGEVDVDFKTSLANLPPFGDRVILVPAHVYAIAQAANQPPKLTRDGMPLATDVEDLQVSFFYDVNHDGKIDADPTKESPGAAGGNLYASSAWDNRDLREVRLNLVTRTRDSDRDNTQGMFQATENRVPIVVTDGYRRRVRTTTVRLRNVGFRGTAL